MAIMSTTNRKRLKIALLVIAALFIFKSCFTGPTYEPPINGQYNSPLNTDYEDAVNRGEQPDNGSKLTPRDAGRKAGEVYSDAKDAGREFWEGVKTATGR